MGEAAGANTTACEGDAVRRIAVIGGGAAGLAAAIAVGEECRRVGVAAEVVLFEADERVGRSILATGNGRCNFSNAHIAPAVYWNAEFVAEAFDALAGAGGVTPRADDAGGESVAEYALANASRATPVHDFFAAHGLVWCEEGEGRQYPVTRKASTVLDVLRASAAACGVREACGVAVNRVEMPREQGKPFTLRMADGAFERADAVVLACGGARGEGMLPESFPFQKPQPILGPLAVRERKLTKALDGIRLRTQAALLRDGQRVAEEAGEVLFRAYGVSGIVVFNMSRAARAGDVLELNLLAEACVADEAGAFLQARRDMLKTRGLANTCEALLSGLLLPAVARAAMKRAGIEPSESPSDKTLESLARLLTQFRLTVEGIGDERQCQVRRGGYAVSAFDARTMEARAVPGLFAAGETLDVDAPCGGYNLHWAWASGLLAGKNAAAAGFAPRA